MGNSSKLNYQIYKYILHLNMQNVYSTQWIRKMKEILQRCGLYNICGQICGKTKTKKSNVW